MKQLEEQCRMRRHELKLSQSDLDKLAGVSNLTTHKFEKDALRNVVAIEKIVKALGGTLRIEFNREAGHESTI